MARRFSRIGSISRTCATSLLASALSLGADTGLLTFPLPDATVAVYNGWLYRSGAEHRGIDYKTDADVLAAADGFAIASCEPPLDKTDSQKKDTYGTFVLIDHQNGYSTLYAHLSSVASGLAQLPCDASSRQAIKRGDIFYGGQQFRWTYIRRGEMIGRTGKTGTTYVHLHFEVARNPTGDYVTHATNKVDPYAIYKKYQEYPPAEDRCVNADVGDYLWSRCPPVVDMSSVTANATWDGKPWSGPLDFNIVTPRGILLGLAVPFSSSADMPAGEYRLYYNSGGPPNSNLVGIRPSPVQTLSQGGTIAFALHFASTIPNQPPTAGFLMSSGAQSATHGQNLNLAVAPGGIATVSFDGRPPRSSDPHGTITGYDWRINNTLVSNAGTFSFGLGKGNHVVTLVVTDDRGQTSTPAQGGVVVTESPSVLNPTLFFDGSASFPDLFPVGWFPTTLAEPVVDSLGRVVVVSVYSNLGCGYNYCGLRLNSISSEGTLNWQIPSSGAYISTDAIGPRRLALGPGDKIYLQGARDTLFAYDASGASLPGWPVTLMSADGTSGRLFLGNTIVDFPSNLALVAAAPFGAYDYPPRIAAALTENGTVQWQHARGLLETIVQGPSRDAYMLASDRIARLALLTGAEVCAKSEPNSFYSGVLGTPDGVFTSYRSVVSRFHDDCTSTQIYSSYPNEVELRAAADGRVFAIEYPTSPYNPSATRLIAIGKDGEFLWRNTTIEVGASRPIRAVKNGVLYVLGQDTLDGNKPKLFLLSAATGEVLGGVETLPLCQACGVAVSDLGTIYLNDLSSTKIYKVN